jgi:hypothetical protein
MRDLLTRRLGLRRFAPRRAREMSRLTRTASLEPSTDLPQETGPQRQDRMAVPTPGSLEELGVAVRGHALNFDRQSIRP